MPSPSSSLSTYIGIGFPPSKGVGYGFFNIVSDEELIKNSIYTILNTKKGSMPMNPTFGSAVHTLLFEPINDATQGLIADQIEQDITTWEPRVLVMGITAASIDNTRYFELTLKIKATNQLITNVVSFAG